MINVSEGITAQSIEKRFIVISYDISNSTLRAHIARKLLQHGFSRINLSVWYGIYSEALLQEIQNFITIWRSKYEQRGLIDIWILSPQYLGDEATFVTDKYEESFRSQWDHVDAVFLRISRILDIDKIPGKLVETEDPKTNEKGRIWEYDVVEFERLYSTPESPLSFEDAQDKGYIYYDKTDEKWRPYRGDQIMTMVKDVQYSIQDLRKALANRRQYESETATPEQLANFDVLDQRLERDDAYLKPLADRCAKRTAREIREKHHIPDVQSFDQSENKGFTE